jgi:hypothetical protein
VESRSRLTPTFRPTLSRHSPGPNFEIKLLAHPIIPQTHVPANGRQHRPRQMTGRHRATQTPVMLAAARLPPNAPAAVRLYDGQMTTNPYQSPDTGPEQTPPRSSLGVRVARVVAGCALLLIGLPVLRACALSVIRGIPPDKVTHAKFVAILAIGIGCTTSGLSLSLSPVRRTVAFWTAGLWLATSLIAAAFVISAPSDPRVAVFLLGIAAVFSFYAVRGTMLLVRRAGRADP